MLKQTAMISTRIVVFLAEVRKEMLGSWRQSAISADRPAVSINQDGGHVQVKYSHR